MAILSAETINDSVPKFKKLPRWKRMFFYDEETKEVYLPAVVAGKEEAVFLCLCFDGVGCIRKYNHIYAPISWLRREYPETAELCDVVRKNVDKALANSEPE